MELFQRCQLTRKRLIKLALSPDFGRNCKMLVGMFVRMPKKGPASRIQEHTIQIVKDVQYMNKTYEYEGDVFHHYLCFHGSCKGDRPSEFVDTNDDQIEEVL